ncbi:MAG TPA: hypothetical protein DEV81_24520, partial [Cyanobacteria bacterium UBA11049]|nr:hypothetical protein [Cyanobacteria bacterium UBA11049]
GAVILIPGILNLLQAGYDLSENRQIKSYPFFRPWRSPGFWLWLLLQISFPSIAFYLFFPLDSLKIDILMYVKAALFGICFAELMNSTTSSVIISIQTHYNFVIKIAYWMIENEQGSTSRRFWYDFQTELSRQNSQENILHGLNYFRYSFQEYININSSEIVTQIEQLIQLVDSQWSNFTHEDRARIIELVKGNIKP